MIENVVTEISGGCHCGGVSYQLLWPAAAPVIPARACGCEYCTRFAATWTSHPDARLRINYNSADQAVKYRFGTETADFVHCRSCGVLCLAISQIEGNDYAVVNINSIASPQLLKFDHSKSNFSGEGVDDRLDRRAQRWIGTVESFFLS